METLQSTTQQLLRSSLTQSSKKNYSRAVQRYCSFMSGYFPHLPPFPMANTSLMYYIASLHQSGLSSSSLNSNLSALNLIHKAMGGTDIFQQFWISRILTGYRKLTPTSPDQRLPITEDLLQTILTANRSLTASLPYKLLFQAMFSLSFYGFLRVGEITVNTHKEINENLLKLTHIKLTPSENTVIITFTKYKHSKSPFILSIPYYSTNFPSMSH